MPSLPTTRATLARRERLTTCAHSALRGAQDRLERDWTAYRQPAADSVTPRHIFEVITVDQELVKLWQIVVKDIAGGAAAETVFRVQIEAAEDTYEPHPSSYAGDHTGRAVAHLRYLAAHRFTEEASRYLRG